MAPSTRQRRLDLVYLIFFLIHVPIIFVDLYPLYPTAYRPALLTDIRTWYIATYKDRFFSEQPPAWFWFFTVLEAIYHVPVSLTSIGPLWKGSAQTLLYLESPILHLNLLLFALQTNLTTAVCIVEYQSWPELSAAQKLALGGLYIPYFVFAAVMGSDMYIRVRSRLGNLLKESAEKKAV